MAFLFDTPQKIYANCKDIYDKQIEIKENNIKLKDLYYKYIEGPREQYNQLYEEYLENIVNTTNLYEKMNFKYPERPIYYNRYTYINIDKML